MVVIVYLGLVLNCGVFFVLSTQVRNRKDEFQKVRAARIGVPFWYENVGRLIRRNNENRNDEDEEFEVSPEEFDVSPETLPCTVVLHRLSSGIPVPGFGRGQ